MANESSTKPTYSELEARIRELDASESQVMEERDAAENALQEAHIALGGDGEWVGKMPPEYPPDSGDLKLDVPELARVRGLLQRQWISVEERLPEEYRTVVLRWSGVGFISGFLSEDGTWRTHDNATKSRDGITHWMPIPNFLQSSELVSQGAESAHSGKQNTADKSVAASPELLPTQLD